MSQALDRLAEAYGIELTYVSEKGEVRIVSSDAKRGLLRAMGVAADTEEAIRAELARASQGPAPEGAPGLPARCFIPGWLETGRAWGVTCQLYGVRSARNHGIGDFEDLARLAEIAASRGADFIGVNPLHALFWTDPERCSPYSPSSRQFINPLYIAIDQVKGAEAGLEAVPISELAALRAAPQVEYSTVAALKRGILERAFEAQLSRPMDPAFARFQDKSGEALKSFAAFEALSDEMSRGGHGSAWQQWPVAYRDCRSAAVTKFAADHPDKIVFHQWLQWIAAQQLSMVQKRALAAGMRIGLYLDLAVGVAPDGAATWGYPDLVLTGARIGAPPDPFNDAGQDWGLAPISPVALAKHDFEPFVANVRALMRFAGAIRMDHAMAVQRLYWIPTGLDARDGGYVRYPMRALLEGLAAASQSCRAIVIGEDLGTVPSGFRDAMRQVEVQSYRVFYFERHADQQFIEPAGYPREALACITTHDLPTLRGWWLERDIDARREIGLFTSDSAAHARSERARDRRLLLTALSAAGLVDAAERAPGESGNLQFSESIALAVHAYMARSPCRLFAVQIEDLIGMPDQVNLPGTQNEYPNWRRKLSLDLASLASSPLFSAISSALADERPRPS